MKKRIFIILTAVILIASVLASCSAEQLGVPNKGESDNYYGGAMDDAVDGDYDYGYEDKPAGDYIEGAPETEDSGSGVGSLDAVTETARKRIQYVTITMESLEYDKALDEIKDRAAAAGGYIESSNESGKDVYGVGSRSAKLVFRIPADRLDEFSGSIDEVGNVISLLTDTKDVTESYYDIEARLASLEAQRDRYMALLEKADTMDEILIIDNALSNVLYQIESYTGTLNKYDSLVAYSTVTLTLREVIELTEPEPIITEEPTFGERIAEAFSDSINAFVEILEALVIGFVAATPFLIIPAAIIVIIIIVIASKAKRRRRAMNAPKAEEK